MHDKASPESAAKLAQERAKQAEAQYGLPSSHEEPELFSSAEILNALADNESGDARLLIKALRDRFLFDHGRKQFFRFEHGFWQYDQVREVIPKSIVPLSRAYGLELARQETVAMDDTKEKEERKRAEFRAKELRRRLQVVNTYRRIKSVLLDGATSGMGSLAMSGEEWNSDPWALQAQDQRIDLKTGHARPGRPSDYINVASPTPWMGLNEPCPTWDDFFASIFDDNERLISYAHRVIGASIIGVQNSQEFYVLWGVGANGKGTLLETLRKVLGPVLAGPIRSEMLMESWAANPGAPNPEALALQGRRIAWASESKEGQRLNSEKVKLFTGGDTISGRMNHSNEIITFEPRFTLFLITNFKPRVNPNDVALWRRLRLLPFTQEFTHHPTEPNQRQRIDGLKDLLLKEASGILAWLVRGCIASQKEGLSPPSEVLEATADYKLHEDPLQQFINERCIQSAGYKAQAKPLHEAFVKWHEEAFGPKANPMNLRNFTDKLRLKYERDASGRHTYYLGIGLLNDDKALE